MCIRDRLTKIVTDNPSLRGFLFGYVSEYKARTYFDGHESITDLKKYDDHDRTSKGDISFHYKGKEFRIEAKSLQTNSVINLGEDSWAGKFQCDASDRREISLPNGHTVNTTCLAVGEFDIVAVSLYAFGDQWRFGFAKNSDLPHPGPRSRNVAVQDLSLIHIFLNLSVRTAVSQTPGMSSIRSVVNGSASDCRSRRQRHTRFIICYINLLYMIFPCLAPLIFNFCPSIPARFYSFSIYRKYTRERCV